MADLLFCAKYPFTSEAKKYVREQGADLDSESLTHAKKRVLQALLDGKIQKFSESLPSNFPKEIFSYAVSRMLISQTKGRYHINRYAVAESKRASSYLHSETDANLKKLLLEFAIPFLPSRAGPDKPKYFSIPVLKRSEEHTSELQSH